MEEGESDEEEESIGTKSWSISQKEDKFLDSEFPDFRKRTKLSKSETSTTQRLQEIDPNIEEVKGNQNLNQEETETLLFLLLFLVVRIILLFL